MGIKVIKDTKTMSENDWTERMKPLSSGLEWDGSRVSVSWPARLCRPNWTAKTWTVGCHKIENILLSPGDFLPSVFMYEALGVKSPELKNIFHF